MAGRGGLQADAPREAINNPEALTKWAMGLRKQWQWLLAQADVESLTGASFARRVLGVNASDMDDADAAQDFWLVLFSDGFSCGPCKWARTSVMRLSAGVRGLAHVGEMDCEEHGDVCRSVGVPPPPHAPQIRAFRRGKKGADYTVKRVPQLYDLSTRSRHVSCVCVRARAG
jgi:hypothetical protein